MSRGTEGGDRRGAALVAAVLLVALLAAVVLAVQETVGFEAANSSAAACDVEERLAFRSGIEVARRMLLEDADLACDSASEPWASERRTATVNGLAVGVRLIDECGKLALPGPGTPGARYDVPRAHREFAASCLGRLEGLLRLRQGSLARRGARPLVMEEMLSEPGVTAEVFYGVRSADGGGGGGGGWGGGGVSGLADCVTLWTDGRVNVNTAPREVLESLGPEVTEEVASTVIEVRRRSPFRSAGEFGSLSSSLGGLVERAGEHLRVSSDCFRAEITVARGAGSRTGFAVLRRRRGRVEPVIWGMGLWAEGASGVGDAPAGGRSG